MASGNDTRIVQMQFDNKNFEKNIATSQKSLDKFKSALDFDSVSKGLKDFVNSTKNLAFDTLSSNIQKLTDKFTGLGNAGEYVLSRIRASLESAALQAEQFMKSLTLEQITVGQGKYDSLTRAVQTIVAGGNATEEKAYSVMERVMEYTNQTSHSFDTMVSQISSLTSMGVELSKAEKMMEGFANASTKAGADAGKAAVAMQTYSKAMGSYMTKQEFDTLNLTARVVTKEWREGMIEAGIATGDLEKGTDGVIKTAKKYGKQVEVTADTIENTFSKKWATKEVLTKFSEKYMFGESIEDLKHPEDVADSFGKTAYLTGQRALTFADAMNAVKEAISSGWMETFRILFGDLTDAMNLFTGACNRVIDALSGLSDTRNKILDAWNSLGGRNTLISAIFGEMEDTEGKALYEGAYGLVNVIEDIGGMISEAYWQTMMNLIPKDEQQKILNFVNNNLATLGLEKPFESFADLYNSEFFKSTGGREGLLGGALQGITEDVGNFISSVQTFFNEVDTNTGLTRMQKITDVFTAIGRSIAFIFEILGGIAHFFEVLGDENHLGPSLKIIGDLLHNLGLSAIDAENGVSESGGIIQFFDNLADVLKPACELIELVVGSIANLIMAIVEGEGEQKNIGNTIAKVGDIFKKVFDVILRFATPIAHFISDVNGIIGDLFKEGFSPDAVEKAKQRFSDALSKLWEGLKVAFFPIIEKVKAFFKLLWENIKNSIVNFFTNEDSIGYKILQPILTVVTPVWNWLKGTFTKIVDFVKRVKEGIQGMTLFDMLKVFLASDTIGNIGKGITNLIKNGGIYKILMGILGVVAISKIISAVHNIKKAFKMIGEFFEDVGGNLKQGFIGDYEWFSDRIKKIAETIAVLVGCVAVLGVMDTGRMIQGVLGLTAIMAAFGGFIAILTSQKATWLQQTTMIAGLSAMAISLGILVASLIPFMVTDWSGMFRAVVGLGLVLTELLAFMYLTKVISKASTNVKLTGFIAFAFSIQVLMTSLIPFMLTDWNGMLRAVVGLGVVLAELIGFMGLMKVLSLASDSLNMGGIHRFALSIGVLIFSLIPFMLSDWSSMLRAVAGLAIVLLELVGFMQLMKVFSLSTKRLNMKGMYKFAFSMGILMLSLVPLMLTDWTGMLRAVSGLGIVLLELIGFMQLMKVLSLSTNKLNMNGMYKFALSVGFLMLSLIPFLLTDWNGMFRAVTGLGIVLAELIGFMALMKVLGSYPDLSLTSFKGFAISIGILMLSLIPFMLTDWEGMLRAVAGLGVVLLELVGFMALMKVLNAYPDVNLGGFIGFALSIAVLALAISTFAGMNWDGWSRSMLGLGTILAELTGFMYLINSIPIRPSAIGMVIAMCLSIGAMAVLLSIAMNEVRNIKWEVIAAFSAGMAVTLIALAGAIAILSAVPLVAGIKAIALLAVGIAAIVGIVALLGPVLISSIGDSLAQLSGKLELVSGLLKGFADRMGTVDEGNINKAEGIFDKLKRLLGKLTGWGKFNGDLNNFSYSMFVLGTGMEIFNDHVGNVATDLDSNAQAALKFIQDLSGCAGDLDTISKMNLNNLIAAVAGLGGAMSIYAYGAKEAQGLLAPGEAPDEASVSQAISILQSISKGLVDAGGFDIPDNMPDEQTLGLFGASLAALATAVIKFEQAGAGLGSGTEKALECLTFFANLKGRLLRQDFQQSLGEAIGLFDKENVDRQKLAEFGANIEQLGKAMTSFNNSTTVLDESTGERKSIDFSNAISTLDSLVELQGKLGWDFGPVIKFIAGRAKDFTDLGGQIEALGTALSDFMSKVGGVDEKGQVKLDTKVFDDAISISDKIAVYLLELGKKLGTVGGLGNIISTFVSGRAFDFSDLKKQIEDLATGLGALGQLKVDDKLITVDDTTGIFKAVKSIVDYLKQLKTEMGTVGGLVNAVSTFVIGRNFDFRDLKTQLTALADGLVSLSAVDSSKLPTKEEMDNAFPMIDALMDYMKGLAKKVGNETDPATVGGYYNVVNTLLHGRKFDFRDLGEQLTAIGTGLTSLNGLNVDTEGNSIFNPKKTPAVITMINGMVDYLHRVGEKLPAVGGAKRFFESLWEGNKADFEYVGKQLGFLGEGLGKFYNSLTTETGTGYDASLLSDSLSAISSMVSIFRQMAFMDDMLDDIGGASFSEHEREQKIQSISDYMMKLYNALNYMANGDQNLQYGSMAVAVAQFINNFEAALNSFKGIENTQTAADILNNVTAAIVNLVNATREAENEDGTFVDFSVIGLNIAAGTAQGIREGTNEVIAAAIEMVTRAKEAAMTTADENSPSKVFMEIGKYMSLGTAMGIRNASGNVGDAASEMGQNAIDKAKSTMAMIAQLMSQEINASPTITPVLDMSNLTAGSEFINGLFNGTKTLNLSGAGSDYSSKTVPQSGRTTQEVTSPDLSWINGSITNLGNRIDQMANKISNLQIVLNTGALVGGISDGINQSLGQATVYSRRRN